MYRCRSDDNPAKFYACKVIESRRGKKSWNNIDADARNEIAIMKMMDHPHVTKLYEVIYCEETHTINIIMEYVDGGAVMSDGELDTGNAKPLSEKIAKQYLRQLLFGLQYMHHHGILHRDIKPSNLLFDKSTRSIKICDFGVSSLLSKQKA